MVNLRGAGSWRGWFAQTRSFQSLGDTDALSHHPLADARLEAAGRAQIHFAAQERLEVILQSKQPEIPDGAVELDQQVYVTGRGGVIAGYRAKQRKRFDAVLARQFAALLG